MTAGDLPPAGDRADAGTGGASAGGSGVSRPSYGEALGGDGAELPAYDRALGPPNQGGGESRKLAGAGSGRPSAGGGEGRRQAPRRRRLAIAALVVAVLAAAHVAFWYLPRERAASPEIPELSTPPAAPGEPGGGALAPGTPAASAEPAALLAAGAYDVCVWIPYPHQNLGALSSAIEDLPEVIGAIVRLSRVAGSGAAGAGKGRRSAEADDELPTFGPFAVPPASELTACADLAGGRYQVAARIYPALTVVAKLAGRLAGNSWLAGGEAGAGRQRIAWDGRLWSVTAGGDAPPVQPGRPGGPQPGAAVPAPRLPESLAVVHWNGARPEVPPGYYTLTRQGSDLEVALAAGTAETASGGSSAAAAAAFNPSTLASSGSAQGGERTASPPMPMDLPGSGPTPTLVVVAGPDWRGGLPFGERFQPSASSGAASAASGGAAAPLPPAALALFETGGSRLTSLGDLPGLAVFNLAGAPGKERWGLPAGSVSRFFSGRLPSADVAGWHVVAFDAGSLRQAEALAPRLAALELPGAGAVPGAGAGPAAATAPLSLGLWLDPRSSLRIVYRIRRFLEQFPLASDREVELWHDWEDILDPVANCEHVTLAATATPPAMRLRFQRCTAGGERK